MNVCYEMVIRRAQPQDLPGLADLWHERRVLQAQADPRLRLAPDEREAWVQGVDAALTDATLCVLVAENPRHGETSPAGFAIGCVVEGRCGEVRALVLDAHRYHAGLGRELLSALRTWFDTQGVSPIVVSVARNHAVEQAFWRSLGAQELHDLSTCAGEGHVLAQSQGFVWMRL